MQYAGLPAGRALAVVDPGDDTVQLAHNAAATVSSRAKTSWLIALDLARDALNGR